MGSPNFTSFFLPASFFLFLSSFLSAAFSSFLAGAAGFLPFAAAPPFYKF